MLTPEDSIPPLPFRNGRNIAKFFTVILASLLVVTFLLSTQLDIDHYPDELKEFDIQEISTATTQPWRKYWKFGLLSHSVSVIERILAALNDELAQISISRDEAQVVYEDLSHRLPSLQDQVRELDVVVRDQELRLREYNDLRNVHLQLPNEPLLAPKELSIKNNGLQLFKFFEDGIDFRRCSISKQFQFYLYPLNTKDWIAINLHEEFEKSPLRTDNPDLACIFVFVSENFDHQNLTYYGSYGHNHVFVNVGDEKFDNNNTAAVFVGNFYNKSSYRPNYDISAFLRVQPPNAAGWETIPPLVPHARQYFVSFESTVDGITTEEIQAFTHFDKSAQHSLDSVFFNLNCTAGHEVERTERFGLCGNKTNRKSVLKQSTFTLIFSDTPSQQHRLYEALQSGVIPVVLSTSAILPFEDMIDWRETVIRIPTARFSELHFILRSISLADVLELRRRGRMFYESYLANTKTLTQTMLSVLRYRLQLPATLPESHPAKPLFASQTYHAPILTNITRPDPDDEKTGPLEPPVASKEFTHNFTVFGMYAHKIWNQYPFYTTNTPQFFFEDAILPSESEFFKETNLGMRPIAPGSGDTFSEALGGNRPREQFTIVIITFNRDDVLKNMLESLNNTPFLNRIIVVWNNIDRIPPASWPRLNVPIFFVKAEKNTLNNRFYPYDLIETEAVLSLDDDMDLKRAEIVFAFRTWRQDRTKIVGFPARYHAKFGDSIFYNSNHTCQHSMILTGAAFIHKSYLYAYTYFLPEAIHNKVDEVMNCEDIAMNFLVAHLTRQPPIKTTSKWTIRCPNCPETLSKDAAHFNERHECIRYFTKVFGYNPLVFSQYRVDSTLFKTRVPSNHQKCYRFI